MRERDRPTYRLVATAGARPSRELLDEIAARAGVRRPQLEDRRACSVGLRETLRGRFNRRGR